jgi:hypothetical protein
MSLNVISHESKSIGFVLVIFSIQALNVVGGWHFLLG